MGGGGNTCSWYVLYSIDICFIAFTLSLHNVDPSTVWIYNYIIWCERDFCRPVCYLFALYKHCLLYIILIQGYDILGHVEHTFVYTLFFCLIKQCCRPDYNNKLVTIDLPFGKWLYFNCYFLIFLIDFM